MIIKNINKKVSIIENDNIILIYYDKKILSIVNKNENILYIKNHKKLDLIKDIDISKYTKISNIDINNMYNNITII